MFDYILKNLPFCFWRDGLDIIFSIPPVKFNQNSWKLYTKQAGRLWRWKDKGRQTKGLNKTCSFVAKRPGKSQPKKTEKLLENNHFISSNSKE